MKFIEYREGGYILIKVQTKKEDVLFLFWIPLKYRQIVFQGNQMKKTLNVVKHLIQTVKGASFNCSGCYKLNGLYKSNHK